MRNTAELAPASVRRRVRLRPARPRAIQRSDGRSSDRGIIMMRKKMLEQAQVVADGGEPKAVIRDPEKNKMLYLPRQGRNRRIATPPVPGGANAGAAARLFGADGKAPRTQHRAGQPQSILDEMDAIWAERWEKVRAESGTAEEDVAVVE